MGAGATKRKYSTNATAALMVVTTPSAEAETIPYEASPDKSSDGRPDLSHKAAPAPEAGKAIEQSTGIFTGVQQAPFDEIFGLTMLCKADCDPRKIDVGVGAYRTHMGTPYIFDVIHKAAQDVNSELGVSIDMEYSPLDGPAELKTYAQQMIFGMDCQAVHEGRVASVQTVSGSGALRVCAEFASLHLPTECHDIWCSKPTWGNHYNIFSSAGCTTTNYPYWHPKSRDLDIRGMLDALNAAPPHAIVLLHPCAHNPTGIDPSRDQWRQIAAVMKERTLIPLLDSAYQGYATGSREQDVWAIRLFMSMGFEMFVCQSFSKNMGLYGERVGMLHAVCQTADGAERVLSQFKLVIRAMYSNPPRHGAHLVSRVLSNFEYFKKWEEELGVVANRIVDVRSLLRTSLEEKGVPGPWSHITSQVGMFSFTGLTPQQCERLVKEHHVYLLKNGRVSVAGLNTRNVPYFVDCIAEVTQSCKLQEPVKLESVRRSSKCDARRAGSKRHSHAKSSVFSDVQQAPFDEIFGLTALCKADPDPQKIDVGVGAYRTADGKPYVFDVVREAAAEVLEELGDNIDHEYSTIDGPADLKVLSQRLIFGADCAAVAEDRVASVQTVSGSGALRVLAEFACLNMRPESHVVWCSKPTWGNHYSILQNGGCTTKDYPYWDAASRSFDAEGMLGALRAAPPHGLVLLHACAHNPTGLDPSRGQWEEIAAVIKERSLIPLLDCAYQGFATGDREQDSWPIRLFASMGVEMFVCQSFSKNMGLYGERVGMLHAICESTKCATIVLSQLKSVIRAMYSNPPRHGAHLVMKVLGNSGRFQRWDAELASVANRVREVRWLLRRGLEEKGVPGAWNHITDQIGMFSFTGLTPAQCERLVEQHHIYLLKSGRISMAGLNTSNIQYMVDCIDEVVKTCGMG